jgi:hypothetical protein
MAKSREFTFNPGRFNDLLLYVSEQLADDPTFGETKLNKILFYSDFEAFRLLGEPITGAEYQKNKHGPTARLYTIQRDELLRTRQITVERRLVVDHVQDVIEPDQVRANIADFSEDELSIIDRVISVFRKFTNTEASDKAHEWSAGWKAMSMGQTIPYASAIIDPSPLTESQLKKLHELLASDEILAFSNQ